jgi:SPOR domain
VPPSPPSLAGPSARGRNNTLSVIAGVGVLLLAMGVGILIGRSSSSPRAARPEVVTIGSVPTTGVAGGAGEATFTGDWPVGKSAYTVQLQTLPETGTTVSQVEQAKSSASAKGATAVGALKSEEFTSLTAGSYIVYSGQYEKQAEAQKALGALKKKFPGAKVIHVTNGSGSSGSGAGGKSGAKGSGSDLNHPAPASVLQGVSKAKGKSYEEKSKNLPNVVETG